MASQNMQNPMKIKEIHGFHQLEQDVCYVGTYNCAQKVGMLSRVCFFERVSLLLSKAVPPIARRVPSTPNPSYASSLNIFLYDFHDFW